MRGFINIFKPENMTSAQAVAIIKKKLHVNCGHMGTLDPMASGILPVGIEKTSRLFPYLLDKKKTYVATFIFGYTTDTLDITGKETDRTEYIPTEKEIKEVLLNFVGEIEQIPPKYSAKCVAGKRGYQLARKGVEFELQPKKIKIESIDLIEKISDNEYKFKIVCGGGTYIRALGRDIALACNSLGVMSALCRTECGVFNTSNSVNVEEFGNSLEPEKYLIPSDSVIGFDKIFLDKERATKILNGLYEKYEYSDGIYRVYCGEEFWGVGEAKDGILRIKSYVK